MHCPRMEGGVSVVNGGSIVEAFVDIGTLIVEGRLPAPGTSRGYKEGPHCPVANTAQHAHHCDTTNSFLCQRAEKLRKHMSLLCSNDVSMCVEVLLCPNCECGIERAQSPEVAIIPSPSDLLLEQWTVSVVHKSMEACTMTVKGLFQAVRSQLHFSQLSAWWSSSVGKWPKSVCYRVTLPGEAFASHFTKQPVTHSFPCAAVSPDISLKVSVRTLPRSESLPVLICPLHLTTNSTSEGEVKENVRKRSVGLEQPLLGESLLDPPGRRPTDRIMNNSSCARNQMMMCTWRGFPLQPRRRPNRHSIFSKHDNAVSTTQNSSKESCSSSSATLSPARIISGLVDDRMQTTCNRPGKHHCKCEDDTECLGLQDNLPRHRRRSQVALPQSSIISSGTGQSESLNETKKLSFDLSPREVEDVLTVRNNTAPTDKDSCSDERWLKSGKNQPSTSVVNYVDEKFKVPEKSDLLLSAILRTNVHSDQKFPLKRKLEIEDEVYSFGGVQQSNLKSGCELSHINCKKNIQNLSFENQKLGCNKNKQCAYDTVKTNKPFSVTKQTDDFRTIDDDGKKSRNEMCSSDHFRTKLCMKQSEEKSCAKYDKFDADLLEKINKLDLNKNNDASNSSGRGVPTALEKAKFRRSLDSAASMVFHWRTGLPLTSSPAPLRRASHRFDFDSSINSVSAISSALFDPPDNLSVSSEDTESEGSAKSPCSPNLHHLQNCAPWSSPCQPPCSSLLGSFEESVLNGRLEPVSTVQGFTADLGASGSFCPRHLILPVTVFFYTLGDNDKVSTPYLAHINLGKKGYVVPRSGTIQVTLLNPLGTVIKMFVVVYDLSDMPANSHTFLRQRTLYMPVNAKVPEGTTQKYLRYLIHLRFSSSKSGRIYLHTDIRMIIFRKSDMDTATGHGMDSSYELRSFTNGPTNPKFSPRK